MENECVDLDRGTSDNGRVRAIPRKRVTIKDNLVSNPGVYANICEYVSKDTSDRVQSLASLCGRSWIACGGASSGRNIYGSVQCDRTEKL